METALSIIVGVGLSAACGFRVFVPILGTSIAALSGHLELADGFGWIGTPAAAIGFGTATVIEIGAYYVPWLDNLLDTISSPAAIVAGTIMTASMVVEMSPYLQWTLAVIAGGGVAGVVQGASAALRAVSTGSTGGIANPVFSTVEWIGSILMTILAVAVPVLAGLLAVILVIIAITLLRRFWGFWRQKERAAEALVEPGS